MQIFPMNSYLIVKPDSEKTVTDGGIALPANVKKEKKPYFGTVLAISEDCTKVKVDDKVFYGPFGAFLFEPKIGEKLLAMKQENIIGIVKND